MIPRRYPRRASNRSSLARNLLWSFLGQVLHDGQYHADPHPGNVLVDTKGTIWLLDFGAVGRLDPLALDGLRSLAMGMALQDTSLLAPRGPRLLG